jgi:hypothetical protein
MEDFKIKYATLPVSSYCTLSASSSAELYPHNINTDYTNHLVDPTLHGGRNLEVALLDLYFTPSPDKQKHTIFNPGTDENKIKVITRYRSDHFVAKIPGRIQAFVEHCNDEFKKRGVRVHFNYLITPEGKRYYVLNLNQPGYTIHITRSYAVAMGFTKASYPSGKQQGEEEINQVFFEAIPVTERMDLIISKDVETTAICKEPEIKSVVYLMSEMNNCLEPFHADFVYDGETITFEDKGTGGTIIVLSTFLNTLFGIPDGTQFSGSSVSYPAYSTINLGLAPEFHLITCSLIEPQLYNSHLLPVLRLIPFESGSGKMHVQINRPQYVPVSSERFANIRIQILDENLDFSALATESDTTVVLHVRSRL